MSQSIVHIHMVWYMVYRDNPSPECFRHFPVVPVANVSDQDNLLLRSTMAGPNYPDILQSLSLKMVNV